MRLLPLGVGDAFSALHYSSCVALEHDGEWLLIDCPHPVRKMLREASVAAGLQLDIDRIGAVALTHLHADHSSGLESYGYFTRFALHRKAKLLAHPAVSERLWPGHLAAGMEQLLPAVDADPHEMSFGDYFDFIPLDEQSSVSWGPFSIECRRTIHHIPTTAFRIGAGGRTLGYSADTAFDPGLIDWLSAADLIVHETNYGVHTPYEKLASLPSELRSRMRLIHYPDELVPEPQVLQVLRQGEIIEV